MKNSNFREIADFQSLKKDVKIGPFSLKIVGIGGLEIEEQNKHEQFFRFPKFYFGLSERDGFILDQCVRVCNNVDTPRCCCKKAHS